VILAKRGKTADRDAGATGREAKRGKIADRDIGVLGAGMGRSIHRR